MVVINMSAAPHKVSFDLSPQGFSSGTATTLMATPKAEGTQKLSRCCTAALRSFHRRSEVKQLSVASSQLSAKVRAWRLCGP